MPTYQYSCTDCGHFFEIFQSFTDDSLTVCPDCEGRLRKVFNAVGVVFKGSGFYRNDSRGQTTGAEAGGDSGAAADGSPKTGGKEADAGTTKKTEKSSVSGSEKSSGTTSSAATPA